jgi:hypothetical protein
MIAFHYNIADGNGSSSFRALTEKMQRCAARIFGFWRGFGEGAGWKPPVTEPKRSQKPKGLLSIGLQRIAASFTEMLQPGPYFF